MGPQVLGVQVQAAHAGVQDAQVERAQTGQVGDVLGQVAQEVGGDAPARGGALRRADADGAALRPAHPCQ